MRITEYRHTVTADINLRHRWNIIVVNAFAAEALGDMKSYKELCDLVNQEFSQWLSQAEAECSKKSHKGWFGGGETYSVSCQNPFDAMTIYKGCFRNSDPKEVIKMLNTLKENNWLLLRPAL